MNGIAQENGTKVWMDQAHAVTLQTSDMVVKRRIEHFTCSNVFWIDGSVETRRPGRMQPMLPRDIVGPKIFIPFSLNGSANVVVPDLKMQAFCSATAPHAMRIEPDSILYEYAGATRNRSFVPFVSVPVLADWFGGRIPTGLRPFLADKLTQSVTAPLANTHTLRAMAMLAETYVEPMRTLAFQSLAMQMVTLFAHQASANDTEYAGVTGREVRAAKDAHSILLRDLEAPPGTSELAAKVNLSERRLDCVFREVFGASIFRTLSNARLDQAYQQLISGKVSVKQISYQMGYKHPSSFSRAFYARFGIYPANVQVNAPSSG